MMSDSCCEAKYELPNSCGKTKGELPSAKHNWWYRFLPVRLKRRLNNRIQQKEFDRRREEYAIRDAKEDDICPESHPLWETESHWGWTAAFNEIGRTSFNIGPMYRYNKWRIGIEAQRFEKNISEGHSPIVATQILPFDEAYTGHPAVKLL